MFFCDGIKELEKAEYIMRRRVREEKGLFGSNEYVIHEQPESEKPSYENRTLANRTLENPTYDNKTQIKKEREKKEKENIDCINHRIISYLPQSEVSDDSIRLDNQIRVSFSRNLLPAINDYSEGSVIHH